MAQDADADETDDRRKGDGQSDMGVAQIVLVTGRAGAGRTTFINALEDIGFETVDTPPIEFIPAMAARVTADSSARLAIGVAARSPGFSEAAFAKAVEGLCAIPSSRPIVVFLDGDDDSLRRRYTETRRRHPLAPHGSIDEGLRLDRERTGPLRGYADLVIDTSQLTPGELKWLVQQRFATEGGVGPSLSLVSFAYKNGLPPEADLVFDCRFLKNPYYVEALRERDGRDPEVAAHVAEDPRYADYLAKILDMARLLLPACAAEGKSYLTLAFGCTGGKHRSVAMAEAVARALRADGRSLRVRHRERGGDPTPAPEGRKTDAA